MNLRIAVCDDEPIICEEMKRNLLNYSPDYQVDLFDSCSKLLQAGCCYDVLFLDIEMPVPDGLQTAKLLREKQFGGHLVFLTSHPEYMPEAFKVSAFRYLCKPVEEEVLLEVLAAVEMELAKKRKVVLAEAGCVCAIEVTDIIYVEAQGNTTVLYLKDGYQAAKKPLKYWAEELGSSQFVQPHKSYLAALRHIRRIGPEGIVMDSGCIVPVSRRRYGNVKKAYFAYIKKYAGYLVLPLDKR